MAQGLKTASPTHLTLGSSPDIGAELFISDLQRESPDNLALQGETWMTQANNWMQIIRDGTMTTGDGFTQVVKEITISHNWMVTSTFRSWGSETTTANQWGNRMHFGFRIYTKRPGVTFKMKDVTSAIKSYIYGPNHAQGWRPDNVINKSARLDTLNYFRIRMTAGLDGINGNVDDEVGLQDANLPTTSCAYGGVGVAIGAYGTGTDQQKLDNAVMYQDVNNLALRFTLDVPYRDGATDKFFSASMVALADNFVPSPILPAELSLPTTAVNWPAGKVLFGEVGNSPMVNGLYVFETSNDLDSWTPFALTDIGAGDITSFGIPAGSRGFFRARRLIPAYGESMMRTPRSVTALPVADVVTP